MSRRSLDLGPIRTERGLNRQRVSARVMGHDLWYESHGTELSASVEAFLTATLLPSLHHGYRLTVNDAVSARWIAGAKQAMLKANQWWGYSSISPAVTPRSFDPNHDLSGVGSALCFSCGIDSFFSLIHGGLQPHTLVSIHGFDVPLGNESRFEAQAADVRTVATRHGIQAVFIRTNLREHPLYVGTDWNRMHGAALASVGHLLQKSCRRLLVGSSVPKIYGGPWGSHWELDSCWSSELVEIVHDGADFGRAEKVWAVANDPLSWSTLRVCWKERGSRRNCGRCDKCISTMLLLHQAGTLRRYRVFPPVACWPNSLDALHQTIYLRTYKQMLAKGLPDDIARAVERLLLRSTRLDPFGLRISLRKRGMSIRQMFGRRSRAA